VHGFEPALVRFYKGQEAEDHEGSAKHASVQYLHRVGQFDHLPRLRHLPQRTHRLPHREAAEGGAEPHGPMIAMG
jgi:hypothetical protein